MMDSGEIRDLIYGLIFLTLPIAALVAYIRGIKVHAGTVLILFAMFLYGLFLTISAVRGGKAN
jgi:hypothetical protein